MVPGSAAVSYPNQLRTSIMQLAANGMLSDDNPKTAAVVELLLGAPVAYKLKDVEEPGDRAVAEINVLRIQQSQEPFFKPFMNHQKHIEVLLTAMRDPKFFLDYNLDQQTKLEELLQKHQAAIAPNQSPEAMPGAEGAPQQGQNPLELLQGVAQEGRGAAQVPAAANGFVGQLGGQG